MGINPQQPNVLITKAQIEARVDELAQRISSDFAETNNLVMIGVLKGAFIFLSDLSRALTISRSIDFMAVSSYGKSSVSSGAVRLVLDIRENIEGKDVLIVEDIVDTGLTLHYLVDLLRARGPATLKTCALVRKAERSRIDVNIDYLGFDIPDEWVVGYGLDYAERHRTLPYIGTITPDG